MTRDPKVDPRARDLLHIGGTFREVLARNKQTVKVFQRIGGRSWTEEEIAMEDWRTWAEHAEVLTGSEET